MHDPVIPTMSNGERRLEAERLIKRARALLMEASEEMAAIYLDHALMTLEIPDRPRSVGLAASNP